MNRIRIAFSRIAGLFGSGRRERELEEEVRFHLDSQVEENLRRGMSRSDAEAAARRSFGGVAQMQEHYRDYVRMALLENLWRDTRFGLHMMRKSPGVTVTAILTIALGVGINASVFTLFNAIVFRPLPLPESDRLVGVYQQFSGEFRRHVYGNGTLFSYQEYQEYRDRNRVFSGVAGFADIVHTVLPGSRQRVTGYLVTCNYFDVLESPAALGRGFLPAECTAPGSGSVIVLSNDTWRNNFAADPNILQKTVRVNQQLLTVVGVAAPGFRGTELEGPAFWTPLVNAPLVVRTPAADDPHFLTNDNLSWLVMIGRLRDGLSLAQARADLRIIAAQIDQRYLGRTTTLEVNTATHVGMPEERLGALTVGAVVLSAVVLILLIGCTNLTNVTLARAAARRREIAVRLAIGASRGRLVRQLVTESLLLSLIGGVLGTLVALSSAQTLLTTLLSHLPPDTPKMMLTLTPDVRVLAYCFALVVGTSLLVGLVPALQATRVNLSGGLKQEDASEVKRARRISLRSLLIGAQVAMCALLLVTAGLLLHGFARGVRLDPGLETRQVVAVRPEFESAGYDTNAAASFEQSLMTRLKSLPGFAGMAQAVNTPLAGRRETTEFTANDGVPREMDMNRVSADYFKVLLIPLVRGRSFTEQEQRNGGAAIVTESTARALWPGQDAVGKGLRSIDKQQLVVVGITADTRSTQLNELDSPYVYLPLAGSNTNPDVLVHFDGPYSAIAEQVSATAKELDSAMVVNVFRLDENMVTWIAPARVSVVLASALAGLAMLLAAIGIYGTAAYSVSRRIREIGIRLMLGAHSASVVRLVLRQAMKPVLAGAILGAVLSLGAAKLLSSLLFGVSIFDLFSFAPVMLLLMAVALVATYSPVRGAVRADPMQALRQE
jgi:predicted permease